MFKITFYIPESDLEKAKAAVFKAGAGTMGNYKNCAWQTAGVGQFIPLEGNEAYIGKTNEMTKVSEYKVETCCPDNKIQQVIEALKKAHPYETPVYEVWKLEEY